MKTDLQIFEERERKDVKERKENKGRIMTLDEEITHLDDVIRYHDECRNEYIQLRDWLKELKTYKEQQKQKTKRQEYIEAYCNHCGFSLNYWTMQHDIANCGMKCRIKDLLKQ